MTDLNEYRAQRNAELQHRIAGLRLEKNEAVKTTPRGPARQAEALRYDDAIASLLKQLVSEPETFEDPPPLDAA